SYDLCRRCAISLSHRSLDAARPNRRLWTLQLLYLQRSQAHLRISNLVWNQDASRRPHTGQRNTMGNISVWRCDHRRKKQTSARRHHDLWASGSCHLRLPSFPHSSRPLKRILNMATGYEALRSAAAWIDFQDRGKIRVTGEDRARLLHAMSTNDVQHLAPHQGLYAFFLSAVGRILADAYIYNLGDSLFLDTEPETAAKLSEHLDKYIIADDATLENETGEWAGIGIEGLKALEVAPQLGISVPGQRYAVTDWQNGFVARVASTGSEGIRIFVPIGSKHLL